MSAPTASPNVRVFVSKRDSLILTKLGVYPVRDQNGVKVGTTEGEKVRFMDGRLAIPTEPGAEITLVDGRKVPAAPILEWVERHPLLDNSHEGFWEFREPAPAPSTAELDELQTLAISHDVDGLEAFIAREREGWARESLLSVAQGTLERVLALTAPEDDPSAGSGD